MGKPENDKERSAATTSLPKEPTHIEGLDKILHGGFPSGRTTLIKGGPGSGKTLFGLEFLYRGALSGNPGIFLTFEETAPNVSRNALTLGWDLASLEKAGQLFLLDGQIDPESAFAGSFNLKGIMAIIEGKAAAMGAGRIVIDALDMLTRFFKDPRQQQDEIFRLHKWLLEHRFTTVLTAKTNGMDTSPSSNYLDFMADCVILLDQRIREQVTTKRLQVVKYRGSAYMSNEYPFLITDRGIFFNPISDIDMPYSSSLERVSSGSPALDRILGGGYQTGTCILISGETGTGKTTLASTFARRACEQGQRVLYVNYEESTDGIVDGMLSLGIDLRPVVQASLLRFLSIMPESMGIEDHLYHNFAAIKDFGPHHLVLDAISACKRIAGDRAAFDFLVRLTHICKQRGITMVFINQSRNGREPREYSGFGISSLIDTIITLRYQDIGDEVKYVLRVNKSRGSRHSKRYHDFALTEHGFRFDASDLEGLNQG